MQAVPITGHMESATPIAVDHDGAYYSAPVNGQYKLELRDEDACPKEVLDS